MMVLSFRYWPHVHSQVSPPITFWSMYWSPTASVTPADPSLPCIQAGCQVGSAAWRLIVSLISLGSWPTSWNKWASVSTNYNCVLNIHLRPCIGLSQLLCPHQIPACHASSLPARDGQQHTDWWQRLYIWDADMHPGINWHRSAQEIIVSWISIWCKQRYHPFKWSIPISPVPVGKHNLMLATWTLLCGIRQATF